jgi:uroporphyrinogen decarboxylase
MIEGGTTRNFAQIKGMMKREPALLHSLLEKISETIALYLNAQIEAGVHAVQLFDTWLGSCPLMIMMSSPSPMSSAF